MQFNRNFLRRVSVAAASLLVIQGAWALESFTVKDIRVEGLQRAEAGTIFASLPVRVGDTYSDEKAAASIKALFGLGLFKDVRIEVKGDVLVVIVEERPTIAEMEFKIKQDGNNQVTNKVLGSYVRYYKLPYKRDMNYKKSERRKALPTSDEFFNIENYKNLIV